ncbi:MAG TPA: hypothetical protein GX697_07060 [Firmicutes bacterium]|nr:hypothetical protein [Bacillota bacterium]
MEWLQIAALAAVLYLVLRFVKKVVFRIIGLAIVFVVAYYLVSNYL